ncbi:hypothetical protein [Donghicola sp.]|jgi:hypothetical protein|uniref:hypothetical protein n=1 Tax=Donghicola sp. TaxID=1929294 RepID=UPI002601582B|nr:hypothetical protein [Donghicola sp.]MCT4577781.1 hypothetical protein [Donghicola sp.]
MTALKEYQRLEAVGIWRENPKSQRHNVVVSLGDATIVIMDMQSRPLTHWSIPAVERANPGVLPAVYHPDGDPSETLEIAADEIMMIEAIEKLRSAIDRSRPKQGRLRWGFLTALAAGLIALSTLWLPDALRAHATNVVPRVKRAEIGTALVNRVMRITGPECRDSLGAPALNRLGAKLLDSTPRRRLMIIPGGPRRAFHLPGGAILLHKTLVEDYEDPNVMAGFALAEKLRAGRKDPLAAVLEHSNLLAVTQLLTTGSLPTSALDAYAEYILSAAPDPIDADRLIAAFKDKGVATTPYARVLGSEDPTTDTLIARDPYANEMSPQLLSDGDWISIQGICQR